MHAQRLLLKMMVFALFTVAIINFVIAPRMIASEDWSENLSWASINRVILRSQQPVQGKKIVLGDSNCAEFIPVLDVPYSLATNGKCLLAGHYILAMNVLSFNDSIKTIYLVTSPEMLGQRFENKMSYNNFVKPFYREEFMKYLTPLVCQKVASKLSGPIGILPFRKICGVFSDVNYDDDKYDYQMISDVNLEYIKRFQQLQLERGIRVILISPPVPMRQRVFTHNWVKMRRQIADQNLESLFAGYFEKIEYLEEKDFRDGLHIRRDLLGGYKEKFMAMVEM